MENIITPNRIEELLTLSDYIEIGPARRNPGHEDYFVKIRNDIPWRPNKQELIAWCDRWNGCFGGDVKYMGKDDTVHMYDVVVYTD